MQHYNKFISGVTFSHYAANVCVYLWIYGLMALYKSDYYYYYY